MASYTNTVSDKVKVLLKNDAANPTLAFGDGDSGFYEGSDDNVVVSIGGVIKALFNSQGLSSHTGTVANALLSTTSATASIPSIIPLYADTDTGIGTAGADILSLIAGGVEGLRISEVAGNLITTYNGGRCLTKTDIGAADYNPSIATDDDIITVDTTAAARAVIFSNEDIATGSPTRPRVFTVLDIVGNANVNNITISLESGNINGAATNVINTAYGRRRIMIDGTNAYLI